MGMGRAASRVGPRQISESAPRFRLESPPTTIYYLFMICRKKHACPSSLGGRSLRYQRTKFPEDQRAAFDEHIGVEKYEPLQQPSERDK